MACLRCSQSFRQLYKAPVSQWNVVVPYKRGIQTSVCVYADMKHTDRSSKWRIEQGKARDNSRYGPLTDLPDYSYLDGRPTPLSLGQKRRREERIQLARQIKEQVEELQYAKDRYKQQVQDSAEERKRILQKKLKPKSAS